MKITKWEYHTHIETGPKTINVETILESLGKDGWELITANLSVGAQPQSIFIFKRPKK